MTATIRGAASLDAPFPGLRAFEAEDSLLFYGRELHVAELLDRLGQNRFVAVVGTSGSGKSSLVRAGLRPALHRGYLLDATSRWRFATMRPGSAPIQALAEALSGALNVGNTDDIVRQIRATSAGLWQTVQRAALSSGESLLIIADQFEELFRFEVSRDQKTDAALFVSLLLEASEQRQVPIYLVVTMRSEFLGNCSEFTGLAEAFNRSQYLVPRLTRDERREAIERPLKLFGTTPAPALVQQVLNDVGDDPDQLPVLQHVLLRTYREWERSGGTGRLEREHYDKVGGIERALDGHGEAILAGLSTSAQRTTEKMFRSLTVAQRGVALRRPRRMRDLYAIAGAADAGAMRELDDIVRTFADREHCFLMLSTPSLSPDTVVDITHESLIRKWKRLDGWVREETRSAEWYADLAHDVSRYRDHEVSLWQDPELSGVQRRRADEGWNEAWANQYRHAGDPPFADVLKFLDDSAREQDQRLRESQEQRDRELRHLQALARTKRRLSVVLALLLAAAAAVAVVLYRSNLKDRQVAELTTDYQRLSQLNSEQTSRLDALQAEQATLTRSAATATPAERARLQELTKEIESARTQAAGSQNELTKLRKDQELAASDRGGLINQIETLKRQREEAIAERDKLQAQVTSAGKAPSDDLAPALQRQLDDERRRSAEAAAEIATLKTENAALRSAAAKPNPAPAPNASLQQVTTAFTAGVRAYDLGNWQSAADYMRETVRLQSGLDQTPKEVRMSGTRFVPYAPQSYLAVALLALKADCADVLVALKAADTEPIPTDLRTRLQSARTQCGAGR
jgi:hypothetical protein